MISLLNWPYIITIQLTFEKIGQVLMNSLRHVISTCIDNKLLVVRRTLLVHFPEEGQFMLDEFVQIQVRCNV